jgi:PAS domain-containing protein
MKQWELTGVTIDVTERTQPVPVKVPAAAQPGDTFRALVDQCPALLWTTDADLVFTSSLGSGVTDLGIGPNQLVGVSLIELLDEEDTPDSEPLVAHQRALRGETVTFEMRWADRVFWARVGPLEDARGGSIGTVCVALDLTDDPALLRPGRNSRVATSA